MFDHASTGRTSPPSARPAVPTLLIVAACLALVVYAYLPTLLADYVAQDQWRAFRYAVEPLTAFERARRSMLTSFMFYCMTGRPLVWLTEALEHAWAAGIHDLSMLRPIVLALVLATTLHLGRVLGSIVGGFTYGVVAASLFVLTPGYSFMYLQSMPAAMVLLSIMLSTQSFKLLHERLSAPGALLRPGRVAIGAPIALFLIACLIYPAWAMLVAPLALLAYGFEPWGTHADRLRRLIYTLGYFALGSGAYFVLIKASIVSYRAYTHYNKLMLSYSFALKNSPNVLFGRFNHTIETFVGMPTLNFPTPWGVNVFILTLFAFYAASSGHTIPGKPSLRTAGRLLLAFGLGSAVLLGSAAPWMLSSMEVFSTRHRIPWYLFFCATTVIVAGYGAKALCKRPSWLAQTLVAALLLIPASSQQNRLSQIEVDTSRLEIATMRTQLNRWLDEKGYENQRHLLVILPRVMHASFVEVIPGQASWLGENAALTTSQNPVSVRWMIQALLRERTDHPVGQGPWLLECKDNEDCPPRWSSDPRFVVLSYSYADEPITSPDVPFVINMTGITIRPVEPVINVDARMQCRRP